ncbi:MAG TPA: DUF2064 domain-containing protein [Actinokineospora sp.]|jgi:glycosyltransferase A (GT-A) superfamily protein (DUF2064 family)|nr:DUF2064 domain-containing protein [Actinokineospora sp.]
MSRVLVVAKAPVAGRAKTRLSPAATPDQAADIAAAALLDTLDAALSTTCGGVVVAFTGSLADAARGHELGALLRRCTVIPQRGNDFPQRLAAAHADTAARFPGETVVQIGMDTPQVTPHDLADALARLTDADAALGFARDGGWWALALRDPRAARLLRGVATSRADTGERTWAALRAHGLTVALLDVLSDVDTMVDAVAVAMSTPGGRFARAVAEVGLVRS